MNSAATTCLPFYASARRSPFPAAVRTACPRERRPSLVGRLAAALRARQRSRRARAAFRDAYEVLHRLDACVLADIGIRPDQLTAVAHARAARIDSSQTDTSREG